MYIISKEEIEIKRTPSGIHEWVFDTLDRFASKEEQTALRLKTYNEIKVFIEESYPLAIFCQKYFSDDSVQIQQIVGNQSYDAIVNNNDDFNYIEITNAIDGEDDKLRMKELDIAGSVPAIGSIDKTATKASGKQDVKFKLMAVSHSDIIQNCKTLIKNVVEKKAKKQEEKNMYPDKTMLIVAFDDMSFKSEKDISEIKSFMLSELSSLVRKFSGLALVGKSNKVFLTI